MAQALGRHEAAIGDTASEDRRLWSEECRAHRGMDAVGADQHVGCNPSAMGKSRLDMAPLVGERLEPMASM